MPFVMDKSKSKKGFRIKGMCLISLKFSGIYLTYHLFVGIVNIRQVILIACGRVNCSNNIRLINVRKGQHEVFLIAKQIQPATRGAHLVPIGKPTSVAYKLSSYVNISFKNDGDHHKLSDNVHKLYILCCT